MKQAMQDLLFVLSVVLVLSLITVSYVRLPSRAETRENIVRMLQN